MLREHCKKWVHRFQETGNVKRKVGSERRFKKTPNKGMYQFIIAVCY
jgi:hypothetical protein